MAELKRAYLFTGDDEVKIDQARKRLAARAQADGAVLEPLSGDRCTPQNFVIALTSPSLLPGTRIVFADGLETWRAADVGPAADAIAALADDQLGAVAVLVCRKKPLKAITEAVAAVGGEVREFIPPTAKELPGWLQSQAEQFGVAIEPRAAQLLVDLVGEPAKNASQAQQWSPKRRLLSELEKLAVLVGKGGTITESEVAVAGSGEQSAEIFRFTDAAVSGDGGIATQLAAQLLAAGEPPPRIVALLARSFGQAQAVAALVEAGRGADVAAELKLPPWLAKKLATQAQARGGAALRDALVEIARLDDAIKGGSPLDDDTELVRALQTLTT
ncbi:MAG: DNA polymerase III subunit delta [Solirubrobacterales bacterium]